jgi:hypothetical protein
VADRAETSDPLALSGGAILVMVGSLAALVLVICLIIAIAIADADD